MNNKTTNKEIDAVTLKRELQKISEEKLAQLNESGQIEFLHSGFDQRKVADEEMYAKERIPSGTD